MSLAEILAELPAGTPVALFENRVYRLDGLFEPDNGWTLTITNRDNDSQVTSHGWTPDKVVEDFTGKLRDKYAEGSMEVARFEMGLRYLKGVQIFVGAPSKPALARILEE